MVQGGLRFESDPRPLVAAKQLNASTKGSVVSQGLLFYDGDFEEVNMRLLCILLIALTSSWSFAETHSIQVSGSAEKSMDPNMVTLNIEIWSKAPTAKQAQQLAAGEYQKTKKVFEKFKLKKEEISTVGYDLNPEYTYDQKTQQNRLAGFRVSQNLAVVLHKTDETGSFLDEVASSAADSKAGVNVNGIQWDSDKRAQVELAGLSEAVQDARHKADEMAKAAGVRVKSVLHLAHAVNTSRPPMPVYGFAKKMVANEAASTEVPAGQIKVRVEVQAEYEIN